MLLPFYNGMSILEILIKRIKNKYPEIPLFIATSENPDNDGIEALCKQTNTHCFRGSENNVLSRFLTIANENNFDYVVRVCGDNPFLDLNGFDVLLKQTESGYDYISYCTEDGKPTILSHFGFWGEVAKTQALNSITDHTQDEFFFEHVTNFLYKEKGQYKLHLTQIPDFLIGKEYIRLTIDTKSDFDLAQNLFSKQDNPIELLDYQKVIEHIENSDEIKSKMIEQIQANEK